MFLLVIFLLTKPHLLLGLEPHFPRWTEVSPVSPCCKFPHSVLPFESTLPYFLLQVSLKMFSVTLSMNWRGSDGQSSGRTSVCKSTEGGKPKSQSRWLSWDDHNDCGRQASCRTHTSWGQRTTRARSCTHADILAHLVIFSWLASPPSGCCPASFHWLQGWALGSLWCYCVTPPNAAPQRIPAILILPLKPVRQIQELDSRVHSVVPGAGLSAVGGLLDKTLPVDQTAPQSV